MTLETVHEHTEIRGHGQEAVIALIRKLALELQWGILPGMKIESALKS